MTGDTSIAPPADRLDLGVIFRALFRGLPFILLFSLVIAGAVFAYAFMQTPVYRAETSLLVEDRESPFTRARGEQAQANANLADDSAISSQMQLLQTEELLRQTATTLNLREADEYQSQPASGLMATIKALLGASPKAQTPQDIDDSIIGKLRKNIVVVRNRDSRVITVLADSEDPKLAADIANGLAQEHVRRRSVSQAGDTLDATKWLEDEISKLRASVLAAETKVAEFRADNDLFRGPNNAAIGDRRLSDLSVQITQASGRRNVAESKAKLIRTLIEQGRPLTSVPDVQNSRLVQALTQQLVARRAEVAQLSATLLPSHPSIAGAQAQVRELEGQIRREASQVAQTLETEARIEQELVQNLQDEVARAKIGISESQSKQVQLNELEREASAQRDLLNALLSRYREAASRSSSEANPADIRVISAASVPTQPNAPKIVQMTLLGFVGGFFLSSIWVMGRAFPKATRPNPNLQPRYDAPYELQPAATAAPVQPAPQAQPAPAARQHDGWPDDVAPPPRVVEEDFEPADSPEIVQNEEIDAPLQPRKKRVFEAKSPLKPEKAPKNKKPAQRDDAHPLSENNTLPNPLTEFAMKVRGERVRPTHPINRLRDEFETAPPPVQSKRSTASGWRAELMAQLSEQAPDEPVLLVGSSSAKISSNDCVLALARDYAKNGAQVLVIDASPSHTRLDLNDDVPGLFGLSDLLAGDASFDDVIYEDRQSGISFVPTGEQALPVKKAAKIDILLKAATDVFDKVLVSTGPIGMTSGLPIFRTSGYTTAILDPDGAREQGQAMIKSHLRSFGLGALLFVHCDGAPDQHIA